MTTLKYPKERNRTRLLFSLPIPMLSDLHLVAKHQELSAAEVVRRAVKLYMANTGAVLKGQRYVPKSPGAGG